LVLAQLWAYWRRKSRSIIDSGREKERERAFAEREIERKDIERYP
jgi:hypothetical protein